MKSIQPYIRHNLRRAPNHATYEQCQQIWLLMNRAGLEPQWCEDKTYSEAVTLITLLNQMIALQHD